MKGGLMAKCTNLNFVLWKLHCGIGHWLCTKNKAYFLHLHSNLTNTYNNSLIQNQLCFSPQMAKPCKEWIISSCRHHILRHGSQIRPQLSAAGLTNRPQAKVIKTILIIKLKLWPAAGCEAKAAAEIGSRP